MKRFKKYGKSERGSARCRIDGRHNIILRPKGSKAINLLKNQEKSAKWIAAEKGRSVRSFLFLF